MADALGWDGALRVALAYGAIVSICERGDERWRRGIDAAPGAMLIDTDDTTLVASARGTPRSIGAERCAGAWVSMRAAWEGRWSGGMGRCIWSRAAAWCRPGADLDGFLMGRA